MTTIILYDYYIIVDTTINSIHNDTTKGGHAGSRRPRGLRADHEGAHDTFVTLQYHYLYLYDYTM